MKPALTIEYCDRRIAHWRWIARELDEDMQWLPRTVIEDYERKKKGLKK